jgi:RHH-type transcriptional regulator, proline utilization regulon repressor / proline dehydrogenase / delta 1-pyrroline-5-carboxylate dehydrogenase
MSADERIKGVIFTGSTEVAQSINRNLAQKNFDSVLIAETGGQNAMIVDSSALPEQVVADVISSGFDSAGQRCSALRVLYLQADIADKIINMLKGAMDELQIGNPCDLATDIGPVIDLRSQQTLLKHIDKMRDTARMVYQVKMPDECKYGTFVPPTLIEIGSIHELEHEVFGPIIHIIRFDSDEFEQVIAEINSTGYGLTQGLHSRIETNMSKVYEKIHAGNIYINRNMVGAVVGVQPFGGEGLSGTGPKAGGPLYLYRLIQTKAPKLNNYAVRDYDFTLFNAFVNNLKNLHFTPDELRYLSNYADIAKLFSPLTVQIDLPGPTGEKNFMFFAPKGAVGLFAETKLDYAKQIIAALVTGNTVILEENAAASAFITCIADNLTIASDVAINEKINVAIIANNYSDKDALRKKLAKRDGQLIVAVVEDKDNTDYDLSLLMTERTVSINITATGGNIDLMSLVDNPKHRR